MKPAVLSCPCGNYAHDVPTDYDAWDRASKNPPQKDAAGEWVS